MSNKYEIIVYDEIRGGIYKVFVYAGSIGKAIDIIESIEGHEYEIFEIEKVES
jgi:hypothetical protein